jgi:hypothetical protein
MDRDRLFITVEADDDNFVAVSFAIVVVIVVEDDDDGIEDDGCLSGDNDGDDGDDGDVTFSSRPS